jgi:hypothetical protein
MVTQQDHIDNIYRSFGFDSKDFAVLRDKEHYALDHHPTKITALLTSLVLGGGCSGVTAHNFLTNRNLPDQ